MKRSIAVLLVLLAAGAALSGCRSQEERTDQRAATEPNIAAVTEVQTPPEATEAVPVTEAETEPYIGTANDYVTTAKQATIEAGSDYERTLRTPQILLPGSAAEAANSEIEDRFGADITEYQYAEYCPVLSMDYEASLNGSLLSVVVTASYEGGNSSGLRYVFDVVSGEELDNASLCSAVGADYESVLTSLTANLTTEYDDKYSTMPGNDTYRTKTFADDNLRAAQLYLDSDGSLMALTDVYAAVGGGHWVWQIAAQ